MEFHQRRFITAGDAQQQMDIVFCHTLLLVSTNTPIVPSLMSWFFRIWSYGILSKKRA
jgi:hypothetical protein